MPTASDTLAGRTAGQGPPNADDFPRANNATLIAGPCPALRANLFAALSWHAAVLTAPELRALVDVAVILGGAAAASERLALVAPVVQALLVGHPAEGTP